MIRFASAEVLRFPRKYSPYRCNFRDRSFGPHYFSILPIFEEAGERFFLRGQPADNRRSYYDPSGHGSIVVYRVSEIAIAFTAKYFLPPCTDSLDSLKDYITEYVHFFQHWKASLAWKARKKKFSFMKISNLTFTSQRRTVVIFSCHERFAFTCYCPK